MIRNIKSNKGLSIVELIIAVTLLAICTVPLLAGFANVALVNKKTKNQIEINAVARLVQQQLIEHIKKGDQVWCYDATVGKKQVYIKSGSNYINIVDGLVPEDGSTSSSFNSNFRYNAEYKSSTSTDLRQYNVKLFKKKGATYIEVQKFMVTAYVN